MMLTLYTSPSCTSCRKARAWLQEYNIPFVERNIFSEPLTIDELKAILQMTEEGTEEIISTRSKVFQKLDIDLDELSVSELIDLIVVGFPKTENNYVSERHKLINDFTNHLKQFTKIKIELVDESYSTIESFNSQKEFGIKSSKIKKTKDQNSAIVILNRYLQNK